MNEGSGDSQHNMVDIVDLAKNAISLSGLKDTQVRRVLALEGEIIGFWAFFAWCLGINGSVVGRIREILGFGRVLLVYKKLPAQS